MNPQDKNTAANNDTTSDTDSIQSEPTTQEIPTSSEANGGPQNGSYSVPAPATARRLPSNSDNSEWLEPSTIMAFGTLFILPFIVIVLCILFFLPYVYKTMIQEPDSGATTQTLPGKLPPTYSDK